jgi:hypothetical protein
LTTKDPEDDEEARVQRAADLRRQIAELRSDRRPPPATPREFVDQQAEEAEEEAAGAAEDDPEDQPRGPE